MVAPVRPVIGALGKKTEGGFVVSRPLGVLCLRLPPCPVLTIFWSRRRETPRALRGLVRARRGSKTR